MMSLNTSGKIRKQKMDTLLTFFQTDLENDFNYDDDTVIDQLQVSLEELRKAKMDIPPKATVNELPTLPFGLEIQPSVRELIARQPNETFDEHFRKNVKGGKAAYYRKRGLHSTTTPEMGGRGADTRSIQSSRLSEYSTGDLSSYYDTAANSRLSIVDFGSKGSPRSSRTSFADGSDLGSLHQTGSRHTPTPLDEDNMEFEDSELPNLPHEVQLEKNVVETLTRDSTLEDMNTNETHEIKAPSQASDYDNMERENMNGTGDYDNLEREPIELEIEHIQSIPVQYEIPVSHESSGPQYHNIPISKSDGFIIDGQLPPPENVWVERKENQITVNKDTVDISTSVHNGVSTQSFTSSVQRKKRPSNSSRQYNQSASSPGHQVTNSPRRGGSRSHPNTPTYVENGGQAFPSPKFVSQLQIRRHPGQGISLDQPNGYSMQIDYTEQQMHAPQRSRSSQSSVKKEITVHHL